MQRSKEKSSAHRPFQCELLHILFLLISRWHLVLTLAELIYRGKLGGWGPSWALSHLPLSSISSIQHLNTSLKQSFFIVAIHLHCPLHLQLQLKFKFTKKITPFPWASTTLASFPMFRKNKTHYFLFVTVDFFSKMKW